MLIDSYTKALKRYDPDLFCAHNQFGVKCVFRKHKRFEPVFEESGFSLKTLVEGKQYVCALTENWSLSTNPRAWGIDHVLTKIRQMDLQANEKLFEEMDAANERVDQSQRRSFRNEAEAYFADTRKEFAKAMDEHVGCTHTLTKDNPRKRLKDRSIKNGNS